MEHISEIEHIISCYKAGQRHFVALVFESNEQLNDCLLVDSIFEGCYLMVDFTNNNFTNSKFLNCNLKCSSFDKCDLTNVCFQNCALECASFKEAITDGIQFINCYCYACMVELDGDTKELVAKKLKY